MITPKEKAEELCFKFQGDFNLSWTMSKRCALITANEMLDFENRIVEQLKKITEDAKGNFTCESKYWNDVKTEIEKL